MDDSTLLIAIASFGTAFAARPFLAALVIGVAAAVFHHFGGTPLPGLPGEVLLPAFLLSTGEMFVLWRLRGFWDEVPLPLRAGGHALVCFITAALLIHGQVSQAPAVGVAVVATFFLAFEWSRFRGQLLVFDPGNGLSLAMLLGAAEVVFTIAVALLAVFFPRLSLGLMGLAGIAAVVASITRRWWERSAEVDCEQCHQKVHACAFVCGGCGRAREPRRALWTGRPGNGPLTSPEHQRMSLTAAGRCARCATPCPGEILAVCPHCHAPRLTAEQAKQVLADIDRRLPVTLGVCAGMSAVPVLGLLVGGVYFRLSRNGSLGRYSSLKRRLGSRVVMLLATVGLALLQSVPVVGMVSLPVLAALQYGMDRRAVARSMA
jgi:hypothetical protein